MGDQKNEVNVTESNETSENAVNSKCVYDRIDDVPDEDSNVETHITYLNICDFRIKRPNGLSGMIKSHHRGE